MKEPVSRDLFGGLFGVLPEVLSTRVSARVFARASAGASARLSAKLSSEGYFGQLSWLSVMRQQWKHVKCISLPVT